MTSPLAIVPALTGQTRLLIGALALSGVCVVLELVRQRRLQERYIVLWIAAAAALLLICVFPQTTGWVTQAMGARDATAGLVGFLFVLLAILALHTTIVISRLSDQVTRLAQELAVERARSEHDASDA